MRWKKVSVLFLITCESQYDSTSTVMKRTREAAEGVFDEWVAEVLKSSDYEGDTVTLYTVDDERPDITMRVDKQWLGSQHNSAEETEVQDPFEPHPFAPTTLNDEQCRFCPADAYDTIHVGTQP
jgi:hypothetical protein